MMKGLFLSPLIGVSALSSARPLHQLKPITYLTNIPENEMVKTLQGEWSSSQDSKTEGYEKPIISATSKDDKTLDLHWVRENKDSYLAFENGNWVMHGCVLELDKSTQDFLSWRIRDKDSITWTRVGVKSICRCGKPMIYHERGSATLEENKAFYEMKGYGKTWNCDLCGFCPDKSLDAARYMHTPECTFDVCTRCVWTPVFEVGQEVQFCNGKAPRFSMMNDLHGTVEKVHDGDMKKYAIKLKDDEQFAKLPEDLKVALRKVNMVTPPVSCRVMKPKDLPVRRGESDYLRRRRS